MENNVTIKITRKGYEIKAIVDNKKYVQSWENTSIGAKTKRDDFKHIQDERISEALDSLSDLYDIMKAL